MCGITGIINTKIENKEKAIKDMTDAIFHRGPDDYGYFIDDFVGLGMRRLSIIDLSTGKQPIFSKDKEIMIFFNGEIYNYKELKKELLSKGYSFDTNTDTEVILRLYEVYGKEMLSKLRGMFVFCIYNKKENKIFIARDYFGIKPLYYLKDGDNIVAFSSEIKSFFSYPNFKASVNHEAVYNYLSYQYNPKEQTFFKNVFKLSPGSFIEIDFKDNKTTIEKYWKFRFEKENDIHIENNTQKNIYENMKDSVSHHMISDVPVGSFLSGGIDSSIIASLMQKIRGDKKIKTFTVGFQTLTEGEEAKQTSDFLDTDHTEITISKEEYFKELPHAIWHFDEPVADPSAIGLYFVAKEASKNVKVVLSGEGADELFGGYNIYLEPFSRKKIAWLPKIILRSILKIPFDFRGKNYIRRANESLSSWYIGNANIFKDNEVELLWNGQKQNKHSLNDLYEEIAYRSDSTKMQYIDINTWLIGDILAKADKMTMAHSLELRVPFLDINIAKIAEKLKDSDKWHKKVTKYMLRESFKEIIPEETRNRRKLGFPIPIKKWLDKDRTDLYSIILNNKYIKDNMNISYIRQLIENHISNKIDNSRKIYTLLALSIWYNIYIENPEPNKIKF